MKVVLLSTYELGRQPFGLASPAAWLGELGASVVLQDLALDELDIEAVTSADLVGFYVPMHTATRLAAPLIRKVRSLNPHTHICAFGLYAPLNAAYLREMGADTILGGEFEQTLADVYGRLKGSEGTRCTQIEPLVSTSRLRFRVPDRKGLPGLNRYAQLQVGYSGTRTVGYTEATRGCKHLCRHCPIVPVYNGQFYVVQPDVVLADIANQVAAGAQHITFGDPDFFNGPVHAMRIVRRMNEEFPALTYDVTIKVQHLVDQMDLIVDLKATGCAFVTSAVESFDDRILTILDKRHTADDLRAVLRTFHEVGLPLNPTFVSFTPWTSLGGYARFLKAIVELDLVDNISPVQYAIRLLIPEGSRLLELADVRGMVAAFDRRSLLYPWTHADARVDHLQEAILTQVSADQAHARSRRETFRNLWEIARDLGVHDSVGELGELRLDEVPTMATMPYMTEPWYC